MEYILKEGNLVEGRKDWLKDIDYLL